MKKYFLIGIIAVLGLSLTACGTEKKTTNAQANAEPVAELAIYSNEKNESVNSYDITSETPNCCADVDNSAVSYNTYEAVPGGCCE